MVAALVLVTGCPFLNIFRPPPPACTTNADCSGNTPVCDADSSTCVECAGDADCDDGAFCNGSETCIANHTCEAGSNPCMTGQSCDETDNVCRTVCTSDADCASDNDECTDERCTNGACTSVNNTAACDDGDECTENDACANGTCAGTAVDCSESPTDDLCTNDTCDAMGACVHAPVTCPEGQTCNPDTGACEAPTTCTMDSDCDDGLACNGAETCDPENADADDQGCVAGTDACADVNCGEDEPICTEADGVASCECPPTGDILFTLGTDNLTGTTGDDSFLASAIFNPPSGDQRASFQTGDRANGLAGTDTLDADFRNAATVTPTSIQQIEIFNLSNLSGGLITLTGVNISGALTFNSVNSTDDITIGSLQELVGGGLVNIQDTAVDMTFTFAQATSTSGTADTFPFELSNSLAGILTVNTAATNGFETFDLTSSGAGPNSLLRVAQGTGTSLVTLNIDGDQDVQLRNVPSSIVTIDGSGASGNVTLGNGTMVGGTDPFTSFSFDATNTNVNVDMNDINTGGGDDTIIFANRLDLNDAAETTEDINCGAGTDIVQASFAVSPGTALKFRDCEESRINATADGVSLSYNGVTGLTDVTVEEDGTTNTMTLANLTGLPDLNYRGDNSTGAQVFDAVTYNGAGVGGMADTVDIDVNNRGLALATGNSFTLGAITIPQIEILTFTGADGNVVVTTGITASLLTSFTATASGNLNLGTVTGAGNTVTTVNLGAVTGNITATFDKIGDNATITLGGGNDTFNIAGSGGAGASVSAGAGNDTVVGTAQADTILGEAGNDILSGGATGGGADVINGGAGTDTIYGGALADVLTGGADSDIFDYDVNNATSADGDTITDFTAGSGGDQIRINRATSFGAIVAALVGTNFTSGMGAGGIVAADNTIIVLTDTAGFATFALAQAVVEADNATTDDYLLIFFNSTSGRVEVYADGVSTAATTDQVLVASFGNMTTAAQAAVLVAANFVVF